MNSWTAATRSIFGPGLPLLYVVLSASTGGVSGLSGPPAAQHPVTVADAITMIRLADPDYSSGAAGITYQVAYFSPDGKRFLVIVRRGNLQNSTNEFSVLLFHTSEVFNSPKPDLVLTMASSSNRDAIKALKWLDDNESFSFLGESPGELPQIYTFDLRTRHLERRTKNSTAVVAYSITGDGRQVVFVADPSPKELGNANEQRVEGTVITTQSLADLVAGDCAKPPWDHEQLFLQQKGEPPVHISVEDGIIATSPVSLSPDGHYALVGVDLRERAKGKTSFLLTRYLLLDTNNKSLTPLFSAPMVGFDPFAWAPDGRSIFVKRPRLPLDITDAVEREERAKDRNVTEVDLATRKLRTGENEAWPKQDGTTSDLDIALDEDVNKPPKIYVSEQKGRRKALLLNLNPQFSELRFGKVEVIKWKIGAGEEVQGGLYLPPDYIPGRRYPLVIQTHGFLPNRFSVDGRLDWSSAFAAQPLAARGIVVLQTAMFASETIKEGPYEMARYEAAIDYLDQRGIIDRNRVGISGFSRTVYEVGYALTRSRYSFAAALLVDGMTGGYVNYMVWGNEVGEHLNGGAPFGNGLELWLKNSPGFNLDKVHTPTRLVALNPPSVLQMWEWFSGLKLQDKPVDFIEIPDGAHILEKPQDRRIAMQGMVDWFCFWLKAEEDPDSAKAAQYKRWRELRKLQEQNEKNSPAPSPN